jgi:hypothetical protein
MRRPRAHHLREGVQRQAQSREPIGAFQVSVRGLLESSGAVRGPIPFIALVFSASTENLLPSTSRR